MNRNDWAVQTAASIVLGFAAGTTYTFHLNGLPVIVTIALSVFIIDFAVGFASVRTLAGAIGKGTAPLAICAISYVLYSYAIGMFGPGDGRILMIALAYVPIGILGASLGAYLRSALRSPNR